MTDNKKVLFLTIGDMTWATSRYRSFWPASLMEEADAMTFKPGQDIPDSYDVYIWMKTGDLETMRRHRDMGKLSFIEVNDPAWWWQADDIFPLVDAATAIVAATEAAGVDCLEWYTGRGGQNKPRYIIPDRLLLSHYPLRRKHQPADPVRFIWFGMANNRISLFAAQAYLQRLAAEGIRFELTICDNEPNNPWNIFPCPTYYTRWTLEKENEILAAHDVALLPPYPGPWGRLKTNNKKLTAWACGLPVTEGQFWAHLLALATSDDYRKECADNDFESLRGRYQTEHTVADWRRIIQEMGVAL